MIAIVDYGMGNVRSLYNALEFCGAEAEITRNPDNFDAADRIILPGVGAFGDAIDAIRELDLERPLTHQAMDVKKPIFGICLGMQLFAKSSEEHGGSRGLGWLDSEIKHMQAAGDIKVPQVGWNQIKVLGAEWLFEGLPAEQNDVYFVHSLQMICTDESDLVATTDHGTPITAAVSRGNLTATQFHPEKSQDNGLQILQNWLEHDY